MKKFLFVSTLILSISTVSFAGFSDMPNNEDYQNAVNGLEKLEVISGYEDNTFRPDKNITRAEFTKMVVTAMKYAAKGESNFKDTNGHWSEEYINIAIAENLIKGYDDNTFRPDESITYGEVATILVRALGEEKKAIDTELEWPENYMSTAETINLFDGYYTNDLMSSNFARRDNVALMLWNALKYKENSANKEAETETETKIDTKKGYAGIVTSVVESKGKLFVRLNDSDVKLELYDENAEPSVNTLILYKFTSNGKIRIIATFKISDVDSTYSTVESADKELIKLDDQAIILDLDLEKYTWNSKQYKLEKISYIVIEIEDEEILDFEIYQQSELKLKKDDKIKFNDNNSCYVVRYK